MTCTTWEDTGHGWLKFIVAIFDCVTKGRNGAFSPFSRLTSRDAELLLADYSLLPPLCNGLPFQSIAFDPYVHLPHDPSHSELAGISCKVLELTMEMLSKDGRELL